MEKEGAKMRKTLLASALAAMVFVSLFSATFVAAFPLGPAQILPNTFMAAASSNSSAAWVLQTIDSEGNVGHFSSLALDSNGYPHIGYYDENNGNLKYAKWTGTSWSIRTVDNSRTVGTNTSIALDANGRPHISYFDWGNQDLKYAKWTGSGWEIQTVDSAGAVGEYTSLALDVNGYPHISYYAGVVQSLKYAKWTGISWNIQTVDGNGVGGWTSLALDANGYPHISYFDFTNKDLKYAKWTGSNWSIQTVDSMGDVGRYSSLALDTQSNPQISYYDAYPNLHLKYAKWTGTNWEIQTVDNKDGTGLHTSIALDSNGYPHISYYDTNYGDLRYAKWTGVSWNVEVVDSEGTVGGWSSLALDSADNPRISYHDTTNGDLKYAIGVKAQPISSSSPTLIKQWNYQFGHICYRMTFGPSPAVADLGYGDENLEIVTGNDEWYPQPNVSGRWFAFDVNGNVLWILDTGNDESRSSVAIADIDNDGDLEIAGGTTSGWQVQVFDHLGRMVWTYDVWDFVHSSPAVADVRPDKPGLEVIAGSYDRRVYAFDASGGLIWTRPTNGMIISSPAVGDVDADGKLEVIVASSNVEWYDKWSYEYSYDPKLYCLDGATGAIKWIYTFSGACGVASSAALANLDHDAALEVIIGSGDGNVYSFDGATGAVEWTYRTGGGVYSSPAIGDVDADGKLEVVVGSNDGKVYCLDGATGALEWSYVTGGAVWSSPALANRGSGGLGVYVGSDDKYLYLIDGRTGVLIDRFLASGPIRSSPVVADIDGDQKLEVLFTDWSQAGGNRDWFWCLEDTRSRVSKYAIEWGMFRHDERRTGLYSVAPTSSIDPIEPYWRTEPWDSPYSLRQHHRSNTLLTITATANSPISEIENVTFYYRSSIDNVNFSQWIMGGTDTEAPWKWTFWGYDGGYYEFYSIATDAAGNTESPPATADAFCAVDMTAPTSSVDEMLPYWQAPPFTVTAIASDAMSGVENVELLYRYSMDNVSFGPWTSFEVDIAPPWSWTFTGPEGDGYYEFSSIATDAAGNIESPPTTGLVNVVGSYYSGFTILGSYDAIGSAMDVQVVDNVAYVVGNGWGLRTIDVADPTNPTLLGSIGATSRPVGVYVVDNFAYIVSNTYALQFPPYVHDFRIIDVIDTSNPTLATSFSMPGFLEDVYVVDGIAYVVAGYSGLYTVNVANQTSPTILGWYYTYPGAAFKVQVVENIAYIADYYKLLQLIDVSNPSHPTLLSSFISELPTPRPGGQAYDIYIEDNIAYVAGSGGLRIINVSDPMNPVLLNSLNPFDLGAIGVYVVNDIAYVIDGQFGLHVIDVTNPDNPFLIGYITTPGRSSEIYVKDGIAYIVANETSWLKSSLLLIDVSLGKADVYCGVDASSPSSNVDPISLYWRDSTAITITATATDALSGVGSVTLYYRHSADNVNFIPWTEVMADTAAPWEWTLDLTENIYYEFYSVARDVAGNVEAPPATADASCAILRPNVILATVRIKPEVIDLTSKGVFTAFIKLPEGYDVADIVISTIVCEGAQARSGELTEGGEFAVKFRVQDLDVEPGTTELVITGALTDGTKFIGGDFIIGATNPSQGDQLPTPPTTPPEQPGSTITIENLIGENTSSGGAVPEENVLPVDNVPPLENTASENATVGDTAPDNVAPGSTTVENAPAENVVTDNVSISITEPSENAPAENTIIESPVVENAVGGSPENTADNALPTAPENAPAVGDTPTSPENAGTVENATAGGALTENTAVDNVASSENATVIENVSTPEPTAPVDNSSTTSENTPTENTASAEDPSSTTGDNSASTAPAASSSSEPAPMSVNSPISTEPAPTEPATSEPPEIGSEEVPPLENFTPEPEEIADENLETPLEPEESANSHSPHSSKKINASVKIEPKVIEINDKGRLTASIKLPMGHSVRDIDLSTVTCRGARAKWGWIVGENLVAEFEVDDVADLELGDVELTVTGELKDGISFEGSDSVVAVMAEAPKKTELPTPRSGLPLGALLAILGLPAMLVGVFFVGYVTVQMRRQVKELSRNLKRVKSLNIQKG